jgi:hypothetical protein
MRAACQGTHSFDGPKKLALLRMLRSATERGRAILVVLPVSPFYTDEFLGPGVAERFEATLAEVQQSTPEARLVRFDKIPELRSNAYFADLVHLNYDGRQIATEAFLKALRAPPADR